MEPLISKAAAVVISVAMMPPVVVKTVPQSGDTAVNPSITEIRVTFSKEMADGSWSWSQISDETFPEVTGKPRYLADKRTCVLPVKLEPGKSYASWLNSAKFGNFKDAGGRSAVPYLLVFETAAKGGTSTPAPAQTRKRDWGPEQATGAPDTPATRLSRKPTELDDDGKPAGKPAGRFTGGNWLIRATVDQVNSP